jgi:hypothetical protein
LSNPEKELAPVFSLGARRVARSVQCRSCELVWYRGHPFITRELESGESIHVCYPCHQQIEVLQQARQVRIPLLTNESELPDIS